MFNLENTIKKWKRSLAKYECFEDGYIAELESHLRDNIDDLVKQGFSQEQAFSQAVENFGPIGEVGAEYHKTHTRRFSSRPPWQQNGWILAFLRSFLKIGFRRMKLEKGFSIINIAGLALGIACSLLILRYVKYELSYENFHTHANYIYRIVWEQVAGGKHYGTTPSPLAPKLQKDVPEIKNIVRWGEKPEATVRYGKKIFLEKKIIAADPSILTIFTFPFIHGDVKTALQKPDSILLTQSMAKKYFSNQSALRKVLEVDGQELTVTAVVKDIPKNSELQFDFLIPFTELNRVKRKDIPHWNSFSYNTFIQIHQGIDIHELSKKISALMKKYRSWDEDEKRFYLQPLKDLHLYRLGGGGLIQYITIFSLIAFFILCISCINFINLSTARYGNRALEVGLRKVLGSQRMHLISRFFMESMINIMIAFVFAIILVELFLPYFNSLVNRNIQMEYLSVQTLLGFFIIFLISVVLSGIYPAIYLSSVQPVQIFRGPTISNGKGGFRKLLVIIQYTISIMLIISLSIILKQTHFMKHADLGFAKENLLSIPITESMARLSQPIKNQLLDLPGILKVTAIGPNNSGARLRWENMNKNLQYMENEVRFLMVDYDFLDSLQAKITAGRNFSKQFTRDWQYGYIINEQAARLWQLGSPLGTTLSLAGRKGEIIGIVKDIYEGYKKSIPAQIYYLKPLTQWDRYRKFIVRIKAGETKVTIGGLEEVWSKYEKATPFKYSFIDEEIDQMYKQEELIGTVIKHLTLLAIFITCLGLLGLASFMAESKTKEIGIRKVLGADVSQIFIMLNQEFLKCLLIANVIALPTAWYFMNNWLKAYPYRTPVNLGIFIMAILLSALITLFATSIQALKSAYANPVDVLLYE
jgi:ABC-type antimicrobial peptide transport system permease subunit